MNILLTLAGILCFGALTITVFTMGSRAAKKFQKPSERVQLGSHASHGLERRQTDRRQNLEKPTIFPITINGEIVPEERRMRDRRTGVPYETWRKNATRQTERRQSEDRRHNNHVVQFPAVINGTLVESERRMGERRVHNEQRAIG